MSTKMECKTCNGAGWGVVYITVPVCCMQARDYCGGDGCHGPDPVQEEQQQGCDDCQATGFQLEEKITLDKEET